MVFAVGESCCCGRKMVFAVAMGEFFFVKMVIGT